MLKRGAGTPSVLIAQTRTSSPQFGRPEGQQAPKLLILVVLVVLPAPFQRRPI